VIFDGTVGLGGHAAALLPRVLPDGRYIGLDLDEAMLAGARERLSAGAGAALYLVKANYADFPDELARIGVDQVDHMLLDLGVNSAQLADPARGFSFERDGELDMRYDRSQKTRALDLVNALSERELADLFYEFGQEGMSRKIAKQICRVRHGGRITTTRALAAAVESTARRGGEGRGRIHPATRVFQSLRVAVNCELENLEGFLEHVTRRLRPGGKLAVISFHSLEDAIVKRYVRGQKAAGTMEELTRRPVVADPRERKRNPRSRSAKLRVARRLEARP
jgi:16S rRNA (cytosine1402-N4)-methyltransferase